MNYFTRSCQDSKKMNIVVFTGAGVSRESGLKTFRDAGDGLWEGYDIREVASALGWKKDPAKVLEFYNMRRRQVLAADPNAAHHAIAQLERDHEVIVITQNIDDLHERAGSSHVIHLHGEILKVRPENNPNRHLDWTADLNVGDVDPLTGVQLRPHVVWFGEGLPLLDDALDIAHSPDVDALIIVGTTLNVFPAALVATDTKAAQVFLVDPAPPQLYVPNLEVIPEAASTGVSKLVERLRPTS